MMRRWTQRPQLRLITELSLTPLLTVVIVLLLVFMLAGPLLRDTAATLSTGGPAPSVIAHLVLNKGGTITLDERPVLLADLKEQLAAQVKSNADTGVQVQMDHDLPVQVLVELMDVLKQAGVQKTAVATTDK